MTDPLTPKQAAHDIAGIRRDDRQNVYEAQILVYIRRCQPQWIEALELYERLYGAERCAMLRRLHEWKDKKLTHAEGALMERDLPNHEKLDNAIRALPAPPQPGKEKP